MGGNNTTPEIDPCVHMLLLRELVKKCVGDDESLKRLFKNTLKASSGEGILDGIDDTTLVHILDPHWDDAPVARMRARKECEKFIAQLSREVRGLQESIAEGVKQLDQIDVVWYEPAGRLQKLQDGQWLIRGGDHAARANRQLFFIREPFAGSGVRSLVRCDAEGQVPQGVAIEGLAGSPVFLRRERKIGESVTGKSGG